MLAHTDGTLQIDACNTETHSKSCTAAGVTQQQQGWGHQKVISELHAELASWHSQNWFVELRGFYVNVLLDLPRAAFMPAKDAKPCHVFSKIFTPAWIEQMHFSHQERFKKQTTHLPECDVLYWEIYFRFLFLPVIRVISKVASRISESIWKL